MKVQRGADVYLSPTEGTGREPMERECFKRGSKRSAWGGHVEVSGRMCQVPSSYSRAQEVALEPVFFLRSCPWP